MVTYNCPNCGKKEIIGLEVSIGVPKHECPKCKISMKKE